jgi:hypothetical protein
LSEPRERCTLKSKHLLLTIVEYGGYPDFSPLYRELGFEAAMEYSMRKGLAAIKKRAPAIVVAEFNYQTTFRDRISNLETLMAAVQRLSETKVIVFYERELEHQFDRLRTRFSFFDALQFPIDGERLKSVIERAAAG